MLFEVLGDIWVKHILGDNWMQECVAKANQGGIERVLV
jgi:hypothetical protein